MLSSLFNWLGEGNPQLLREIKGRLKPRNVAIAATISIVGQILIYYLPHLVGASDYMSGQLFSYLSILGMTTLLVIGTYLLITDLSKEESRGTLNFIRLSPQSAKSILTGKILGVPILLYLATLLAFPLHIWSGLATGIPFGLILAFYALLGASCAFFYSAALLYGMVSTGLGSFQPWLGSGAVLFFLYFIRQTAFGFPNTFYSSASFHPDFILFWYVMWTYWIWQALQRRFHNPKATLLSKQQSYCLTGTFVVIWLTLHIKNGYLLFPNFNNFQFWLLVLGLSLTAALTPHRQALQDWARYRHQASLSQRNLLKDLMLGERSPSIVAITLNLGIIIACLVPAILLFPLDSLDNLKIPQAALVWFGSNKIPLVLNLLLSANMILIYAAIAQLIPLLKTKLWLRLVSFVSVLGISFFLFFPVQYATYPVVFLTILGQWSVLASLGFQISRKLQQEGRSETKELFSTTEIQ